LKKFDRRTPSGVKALIAMGHMPHPSAHAALPAVLACRPHSQMAEEKFGKTPRRRLAHLA
jgi:hypothetical protein